MTPTTRTARADSPRRTPTIRGLPRPLARALEAYAGRLDVERIQDAYALSRDAHSGQTRASGESYVNHTVEVATILAQLRMDSDTIIAGLVHDVVEDTHVTLQELEERFGKGVAIIVDGVTKIGKVQFSSHTERQAENYRKLLLSMAQDARVILIKLADRLHNMRTLEHLPREKQRRIARETREIYSPLAHRLGIASIKWELEDLAFKFIETEAYDQLTKKVQQRRKERERQVLEMQRPLEESLKTAAIPCEVTGRPKHLWSIYKKMEKRNRPYEEIYDLMAMRVITDSIQHCYAALGIIHSKWTPIQERFHDYIATPKSNMYRSIHTTVFGPGGRRYEIQIRTEEMHRTAEFGIAAHWRYKEGVEGPSEEGASGASSRVGDSPGDPARSTPGDDVDEALSWFRQVLEWQQDAAEPEEFMEFLKLDLFLGEIFVFTPKGEVKQLPAGSTPIDFAYSVHTEVGTRCAGAKVNGRIAPLSRELVNGDTVEILTLAKQKPSRDWLAFVKTSRARTRIRQWIRAQEFDSSVALGRDFLDRELKKVKGFKASDEDHARTAKALGYPDMDHVHAALGRGDVGPSAVLRELLPKDAWDALHDRPSPEEKLQDQVRPSGTPSPQPRTGKGSGVKIHGLDNLMVRYSQCCQPVPGDKVIGYVTVGRGISIHREDCPNVLTLPDDPDRRMEIEWTAEKSDRFQVKLYARGSDRRGLLSDLARAITDSGTDIQDAAIKSNPEGMEGEFVVEVQDLDHLQRVLNAMHRVKGVHAVERREHFGDADVVEA
ncbi:MAG: bifunctional (p)ppGpp synthetase/guanosine-3',5'-bis(diphosphate) 3'-pyrophosphohydrolase [Gemmatimonadota bacterium]